MCNAANRLRKGFAGAAAGGLFAGEQAASEVGFGRGAVKYAQRCAGGFEGGVQPHGAHLCGLFQRGQTQVMSVCTLGMPSGTPACRER